MIMGHSYEFVIPNEGSDWEKFEEVCGLFSSRKDIWSVTMRDYAAYVQVIQRVQSDLNYRKEVNNTGTFFDLKMMAVQKQCFRRKNSKE